MALTRSDKRFIEEVIDEKLDLKLGELKDDFYAKIDPVLKEVMTSREERVTAAEQHRRNQDRIEKLEKIHPKNTHLAAI